MGRRSILSIAALAMALAAGCTKKVDDAGLATEIKSQMFSDAQLNGADLQVTSKDGQVTLSGTVPNDAARYDAYKIASQTAGVKKVTDQMTVETAETPEPVPASTTPEAAPAVTEKSRGLRQKSARKPAGDHEVAEYAAPASPEPAPETSQEAPPAPPPAIPPPSIAPPAPASTPQPQPPAPPPPPQPKQVEIPANSTLTVRMIDGVDSSVNNAGEIFHASLESPLEVDNEVVVPRGADIYVRLVSASKAGRLKGKSELHLELVKMEFQGRSYPLVSSVYSATGGSRGKNTAAKVGGGAALGAIIGAIAGGGRGAGIGAGVGAAGGAIYQGSTKSKQVKIPVETRLDFQLEQPVMVTVMPRPSSSADGEQ